MRRDRRWAARSTVAGRSPEQPVLPHTAPVRGISPASREKPGTTFPRSRARSRPPPARTVGRSDHRRARPAARCPVGPGLFRSTIAPRSSNLTRRAGSRLVWSWPLRAFDMIACIFHASGPSLDAMKTRFLGSLATSESSTLKLSARTASGLAASQVDRLISW